MKLSSLLLLIPLGGCAGHYPSEGPITAYEMAYPENTGRVALADIDKHEMKDFLTGMAGAYALGAGVGAGMYPYGGYRWGYGAYRGYRRW